MNELPRRDFLSTAIWATAAGAMWRAESGLAAPAPGVERTATAQASAEERLRQPDIWVMEVTLRPLRMIRVNLPNPKTGKVTEKLVWYLCYRATNRPIEVKTPLNELPPADQVLAKKTQVFVPEFTLITDDDGKQLSYIDSVMPAAQPLINERERGQYKNSIEIVGSVPAPVPVGTTGKSLQGVAMWRGIDPTADRFRVFMTGFSNGYLVTKGPDGQEIVQRKTLVQEYRRPGDEIDQDEREIRSVGDPLWIYR